MLFNVYHTSGSAGFNENSATHISPLGSVTIDSDTRTMSIHDGMTAGGIRQLSPSQLAFITQMTTAGTVSVTIPNSLNSMVTI